MRPWLARVREGEETRSIGRAIAFLFLLTGLIGAFAAGAEAGQPADDGIVHCLSGLVDADDDGDGAANCCTLGCPIVTAALPAPAIGKPAASPRLPSLVVVQSDDQTAAPPVLTAGSSPRGPPVLI